MIGSFIGIFLLAMLYEGLKVFREVLQHKKGRVFSKRTRESVRYELLNSSNDELPEELPARTTKRKPKPKYVLIHPYMFLVEIINLINNNLLHYLG